MLSELRLYAFAAIVALIVGASVGIYTATKITDDVHRQVHYGLLYNCNNQKAGRVQGQTRAFVQRTFLSSSVAVSQRAAAVDADLVKTIQGIPPGPVRTSIEDAFSRLAAIRRLSADYWVDALIPLIKDLPVPNCEKVFTTDRPPAVVVPTPPDLPMPPPLLVPK